MTMPETDTMRVLDKSVPIEQLPRWVWIMSLLAVIVPLIPLAFMGLSFAELLDWRILAGFVALILAHEGVHALAWKYASGLPWSAFTFGILWKTLTPYCHAKQPMSIRAYRIGAAAPGIVTGVLPYAVALFLGSPALLIVSALLISGAAGDVYILWLLRDVPDEARVKDHDTNAGAWVYLP